MRLRIICSYLMAQCCSDSLPLALSRLSRLSSENSSLVRTHWSRYLDSGRICKRYGVGLANSQLDPRTLIYFLCKELLSELLDKPR